MKKRVFITALVIGLIGVTNAAVVTYDFNSGLGDSTSGSDLTAGTVSYAVGTQSSGAPDSSERAWDQTSASGNYLLNFGQRGLGNSGVNDTNLTTTAAATLQFTLTPNSGEALDFSASTLDFLQSAYADTGNIDFGYKIWADTGGGFVAVGVLQTMGSFAFTSGTEGRLLQTDEVTDLPFFLLTDGTIQSQDTIFSFDLSSLGALAADESVTFAVAMSTDRNNQFNFGSGIDDLVINNITVPEPATIGLLGFGALISMLVRRVRA